MGKFLLIVFVLTSVFNYSEPTDLISIYKSLSVRMVNISLFFFLSFMDFTFSLIIFDCVKLFLGSSGRSLLFMLPSFSSYSYCCLR